MVTTKTQISVQSIKLLLLLLRLRKHIRQLSYISICYCSCRVIFKKIVDVILVLLIYSVLFESLCFFLYIIYSFVKRFLRSHFGKARLFAVRALTKHEHLLLSSVRVKHSLSKITLLIAEMQVVPIHGIISSSCGRHRTHLSILHLLLCIPCSRRLALIRLPILNIRLPGNRRRLRVVFSSVKQT